MKIGILSNTNIDILVKNLKKSYEIYTGYGYGNYLEELIQINSNLQKFQVDILFIILDGDELIEKYNNIDLAWEELEFAIMQFRNNNPNTEVYISNIDIQEDLQPYHSIMNNGNIVFRWNSFLETIFKSDFRCFDLLALIRTIGSEKFYSNSLWYLSSTKFSNNGIKLIQESIVRIIRAKTESRKKSLIIDLDNTIWGGVLGELGPNNIIIERSGDGRIFYDFQKSIKKIKDLGVILCITSKNNFEDVDEVFRNNKNLVLKLEDFTIIKANWNSKTENIKEIAEELNIGLDSFVFIDDNPMEREIIKINLPDVVVPEFPTNIYELDGFIKKIYRDFFFTLSLTEEDKGKNDQYQANIERKHSESNFRSYEEYLNYLNIQLDLHYLRDDEFERAAQLTQKTNQFNLTSNRFTIQELKEIQKNENMGIFIGNVQDRFGDYGKVVLVIYNIIENKLYIETFLMSCRVMGKQIEDRVINSIECFAKKEKLNGIVGCYKQTPKNTPVKNFYADHGYILKDGHEDLCKYYKEMR